MRISLTRAALVWAAILCAPAVGRAQQRPLVTEDPEPIGAGRVLVEAGVDWDRDLFLPISGLRGDVLTLRPGFSVGLSSLAEVQFDGGIYQRMRIARRLDGPFAPLLDIPGDTTQDSGDLSVSMKIKFLNEAPGRPAMGFRFSTRLPNASNESGLGQDTTDFLSQIIVGKTVQSFRIVFNGGLLIQDDPTNLARQDDLMVYNVSLARALTSSSEVVGEYVGRRNWGRIITPGADSRGLVRVGARYTRGNVRVDGAMTFAAFGNEPAHGFTAGVTWVTQAFRVP